MNTAVVAGVQAVKRARTELDKMQGPPETPQTAGVEGVSGHVTTMPADSFVHLNAGGSRLTIAASTLERAGGMLGQLSSGSLPSSRDPAGYIILDVDATSFRYATYYLRHHALPTGLSAVELGMLVGLADFLCLPSLTRAVRVDQCRDAIKRSPSLQSYLELANACYDAGQFDAAFDHHAAARARISGAKDIGICSAYYLRQLEQHPSCSWRFFIYASHAVDDPSLPTRLANVPADSAGDEALELCVAALREREREKGKKELCYCDGAREAVKRALELRPKFSEAYFLLKDFTIGLTEQVQLCRDALGLQRSFPAALIYLSDNLQISGFEHRRHADEKELVAREAVGLLPCCARAHIILGKALKCRYKYEESANSFREAIKVGGGRHVYYLLAEVQLCMGKHREALDLCQAAAALCPEEACYHEEIGNIYGIQRLVIE